ncbi:MAG: SOS response-associated peptidase [Microbacteriaceae bacterium]|nr:MAG: SOS response-associated peptidase [Microbacteriaceae bacterium]
MCGRFGLRTVDRDLEAAFPAYRLAPGVRWTPRYNIAPTQPVLAIKNDGTHEITTLRWGLVPSWAKDPTGNARMINARIETVAEKPAFRVALRRRRATIVADAYYEWQRNSDGTKTPMRIYQRSDEPFLFAGLWEVWRPRDAPEDEPGLETCTILTGAPNGAGLARVHNRMPIILRPEHRDAWLTPEELTPEQALALADPISAEELAWYPISTRVNSIRNDDPSIIEPVSASRLSWRDGSRPTDQRGE